MARESRTLKLSILADVDKLKQSLNVGSKDVDGFAGKIGDFSKKAALAFAAVAAAAGAMAIKIGVDAVKAASDLSETISKVGVLFGDTADDIEKFADGAASSLGQTKQQALDAAATFATFGKAAGLSGKDLSKFSIDFVKACHQIWPLSTTHHQSKQSMRLDRLCVAKLSHCANTEFCLMMPHCAKPLWNWESSAPPKMH
jgi:hypothetical protein